jgi:L,D-transpeptidase ErfK/SrfK
MNRKERRSSYGITLKVFRASCVALALLLSISLCRPGAVEGRAYSLSGKSDVVGLSGSHWVKGGESLIEIARKFDLGYNEIVDANPGVDPFVPGNGTRIILPTSWILPDTTVRSGMVINLSELRLYYYYRLKDINYVRTFPVGIGREGDPTPTGIFRVVEKIVSPAWYVPESISKENPNLPKIIPAGPDNPLGSFAMRLSLPTILIHGTNKPWGIGRRVSHGCIRLYPEDIPRLFALVPTGTVVEIVSQPVKVGMRDGRVYVEVHRSDMDGPENCFRMAVNLLEKNGIITLVSIKKLHQATERPGGMPVDITE